MSRSAAGPLHPGRLTLADAPEFSIGPAQQSDLSTEASRRLADMPHPADRVAPAQAPSAATGKADRREVSGHAGAAASAESLAEGRLGRLAVAARRAAEGVEDAAAADAGKSSNNLQMGRALC